jgi:putative peptidoglycan lipid II flippase
VAGLISAATLLSRVLGLVRELAFAALLGASHVADAFQVAFRIPNLLRDLLAEGALSSAFVPTFTRRLRQDGAPAAYQLANRVATWLTIAVGLLVLAGIVWTPAVVHTMAGEFSAAPGKLELTVLLTRIMMPFLLLVSLAAVAMGMLNAEERYGTPALAPALFNLVAIVSGVGLALADRYLHWTAHGVAQGWAVAVVLGGVAQLAIQLPPLTAAGYHARLELDLRLRDADLRQILRLMAPATVGLAATQVNIFVNTWFASHEAGAVSWLSYAFRLMYLPIGVFGVAAATVATSRVAQRLAADDLPGAAQVLREGLRAVAATTLPATAGLIVLAEPIVRLLYERGRFGGVDTTATAAALGLYAVGLYAYSSVKVLAPAFVAMGRPRVPMVASMSAVAANLVLNIALYHRYGYRVLALGTSVAALTNLLILAALFQRRSRALLTLDLMAHLAKVLVATGATAAAARGAMRGLEQHLGHTHLGARLLGVTLACAAGVAAYVVACQLLGIDELGAVWRRLRGRLRRRPPG